MMKIPAAEGAAKFLYAIAKSTLRWRTASAIASTAIAQAFKKKKHMTASRRAVKVDFRTVYNTEGRGWSVLTDGIRISFTRIDVIGAFYSALRLAKRIGIVQFWVSINDSAASPQMGECRASAVRERKAGVCVGSPKPCGQSSTRTPRSNPQPRQSIPRP